jgi:hypothetical protein
MDFEEEITYVLVTVSHSLQSLDFVIDPFGNGRSDPQDEVIQNKMPIAVEFLGNLHKGCDA